MDAETLKFLNRTVRGLVIDTITKRSERDKQVKVGPSDIGDPCDACLAAKFKASGEEREFKHDEYQRKFSLKAWIGTAVHEKLEADFVLPEVQRERKYDIWEIPGYGMVRGGIDDFYEDLGVWWDYKTIDMSKLRKVKLDGVPESHSRQQMLYGYGLRQAGYNVRASVIVYIPRDSNSIKNIHTVISPYNHEWALETMARAERIWEQVSSSGVTEFESHPDCYPCNAYFF